MMILYSEAVDKLLVRLPPTCITTALYTTQEPPICIPPMPGGYEERSENSTMFRFDNPIFFGTNPMYPCCRWTKASGL